MLSKDEYDLTRLNPDSLAATAELTPRCSVRPSYRLLRPRSRENLYPAGTSHFPRPWAGHVRRDCLTVDVKRGRQATCANPAFLPPSPFTLLFTGANHGFLPPSSFALLLTGADRGFLPPSFDSREQIRLFCPRRPSHCSSRVQIAGFCPRRWNHVCRSGLSAPVTFRITPHVCKSGPFAPVT